MKRRMILAVGALALGMWVAPGEVLAQTAIYKGGAFIVRKVGKVCKLEVALTPGKGNKGRAILTLFKGDKFHSELITERQSIGSAQGAVKIGFDKGKAVDHPLLKDAGKDDNWRWRYLGNSKGLIDEVRKRDEMTLRFSNGKKDFAFQTPLAGSGKAVQALEKCK
ncbi:MAG: hypothetical protein HQL51_00405 [Magnetococcales bacterium]|nr:hypothetical protein [Magnetococcales bacterium]